MIEYDFNEKIVLISGGAGTLGQSISLDFLKSGANVIITYVNDDEVKSLESKFGDLMKKVMLVKVNLMNEDEVKKLAANIINANNRIDVLINAVGGYRAGQPITQIDEKDWDLMMNLNLKTAFLISKHVVKEMEKQGHGKIIHVAARSGLKGSGNDAAYVASKSGVLRLVESLSEEVKNNGINVNCILPSIIDSDVNRQSMPDEDHSKWVTPSEISRVMLFLASEESNSIHGASIPTYGTV